jgi:pimeloyl-ACP methyl ester carboxylesterase
MALFLYMKAEVSTIELYYESIVPNRIEHDDVVLLFLHEALGSIPQWKTFPKDLCSRLAVEGIVYERQGHGKSSAFDSRRKEDYLHNYALKELPAFIEQVIPSGKKIILIGHSDGGTIALLYAHKYPDNVKSIVTLAAHVINEPETRAGIQPAVDAYIAGKLSGLQKYHGSKTEELFYAWAETWISEPFIEWNITSEIKNTSAYGIFIQGKDDQYGTEKQLDLIVKGYQGPSDKIFLDNCGHHPHLEQSEIVIDHIEKKLKEKIWKN